MRTLPLQCEAMRTRTQRAGLPICAPVGAYPESAKTLRNRCGRHQHLRSRSRWGYTGGTASCITLDAVS
jgi:hypothetical protein